MKQIALLVTIITLCISCSQSKESIKAESITIYAAAGTRVVTEEICKFFESKYNIKVERNYASSGTLARQIANGAECDIYISANQKWIKFLNENQLLEPDSITKIAGNSLSIITAKNQPKPAITFDAAFNISSAISGKIAVGDPSYVPVGSYTIQAFTKLNWEDALHERMIMAKDVSSVLKYVELEECDWGVVYYTEAIQSDKVSIAYTIPDSLHDPISFYIGNVKDGSTAADELFSIFINSTGAAIFTKHGFSKVAGGDK